MFFSSVFRFCKTKGYYYWKHNFCRLCIWNLASGLLQIGQKSEKWQWRNNFPTWLQRQIFFDVVLFLLSSLVSSLSFMSISLLALELWKFSFIMDWPEIWKSGIPRSEFCSISGDWGELWIPHFAQASLIECYWMQQNSRVTAFTVF